jgi:hypothetical protein
MSDPDYIAQTAECATPQQRQTWLVARVAAARERGITFSRATVSDDGALLLYEGWKDRPLDKEGNLDQGEPRWQLSAVTSC